MSTAEVARRSWSGLSGLAAGACALLLALFLHSAGPLEPQPTIGQSIGEIAADISKSALRGLKGDPQPEPQARPWSLDRAVATAAYLLGGLAIVLGGIGFILKENRRLAFGAIGFGGLAIGFQMFVWMVMLIAGVVLLCAILANFSEILGGS